ncbi:MAG: hypothetical protein ABJ333_17750 [Algoriphagus sp.]|uniref:hypothetical protein n=1 Tax=Algoriphagus sp. TaxID=1872435 RepID=UPI003298DA35
MEVLRTAILDKLGRSRGKSFTSAEIVQQMYPEDWKHFLVDVNLEVLEMHREGLISIQGQITDLESSSSLEICAPNKL